jgi:hypothetical protein
MELDFELGFLKSREWNLVLSFERRSLGGFFSFKKLRHTVLASPLASSALRTRF